jgi:hypoxanthine-guanine phosphoribosyltransferase
MLGLLAVCLLILPDLVRHISAQIPDVKVDFVRASSYGTASESGGAVQVAGLSRLSRWSDFHVLLVSGKDMFRPGMMCIEAAAEVDGFYGVCLKPLPPRQGVK